MRLLEGLDFIREKIRARDNYTCQKCGKVWQPGTRRFDVHHLVAKMESVRSYEYDKANFDKIITLCHKCHLNLHNVKAKMRAAQNQYWLEKGRSLTSVEELVASYTQGKI